MAQGAIARPHKVQWNKWTLVLYPPQQAEELDLTRQYLSRPSTVDLASQLTKPRTIELPVAGVRLNNQSVVMCNILTIDFLEAEYDRMLDTLPKEAYPNFSSGVPSIVEVFDLANAWLRSLRRVSGMTMVREIDPTRETWVIEYLDDEGNPLPTEEGKFRKRQNHMGNLPWGAIFERAFDMAITELAEPPNAQWDQLMLEAVDELPATGPAVVLAYAAFEQIINSVVAANLPGTYSANRRKSILSNKRTSPLDRADGVLHNLVGVSLRSQPEAWSAANELAELRNKYLHYGIAPAFAATPPWFAAGQLLRQMSEGMLWLEGFLPASERRERAVQIVNVEYDLPRPTSPVFGAAGGLILYLPNDPQPTVVTS